MQSMGKWFSGFGSWLSSMVGILFERDTDKPKSGDPEARQMAVPTNPARAIQIGLLVVIVMFGGFGTWAATAQLNSAVIASGQIKVFSSRKKVQHHEGGIIAEILVSNGDQVKEGDILVRLNKTQADGNFSRVQGQYDQLRATVARLEAERDMAGEIDFPEELTNRAGEPAVREIIDGQRTLFEARRLSLAGELELIREKITQLEQEIRGLEAQRQARREQIETVNKELSAKQELFEQGWASETDILALRRQRSQYNGDIGDLTARIANARAKIGEAELQILQAQKSTREEVVTELRQRQTEMYDFQERLDQVTFTLEQTVIRAPHDGVVVSNEATTIGQVIRPGETIMELVPEDDQLIIEAQVRPFDIDDVVKGLPANVQLTAFSQRTQSKIAGVVDYVSADALQDERSGMAYFIARIKVSEEELEDLGDDVRLQPGMPADVFIQTGKRTPLNYLMQPIQDSMSRAFREG